MKKGLLKNKSALSIVLSSIILCACVLGIGTAVWAFTYSAGKVLQEDYYEGVGKEIDGLRERFIIEKVAFDNSTGNNALRVWIYNYGTIEIEIDVYAFKNGSVIGEDLTGIAVSGNQIKEVIFTISPGSAQGGDELVIEAVSRRGNIAYEAYRIL